MLSDQQALAAQTITNCYQTLSEQQSNLVLKLLHNEPAIYQWQHYPKADLKNTHSQFYYHSHPRSVDSQENNAVHEHGHFHCFIRKPGKYTCASPLIISDKNLADNKKDNLCHLVAIAMNNQAQPTALFTLNHWVVQGLWYPADVTCELLEQFDMSDETSQPILSQWVTAMLRLFKPQIHELLYHRDRVIADWKTEQNVFRDKRLEVTSICSFV